LILHGYRRARAGDQFKKEMLEDAMICSSIAAVIADQSTSIASNSGKSSNGALRA
jgi:hypothetical protein